MQEDSRTKMQHMKAISDMKTYITEGKAKAVSCKNNMV